MALAYCAKPQHGWTPLMYAAARGRADCARLLIDAGAGVDLKGEVRAVCFLLGPMYFTCACMRFVRHDSYFVHVLYIRAKNPRYFLITLEIFLSDVTL